MRPAVVTIDAGGGDEVRPIARDERRMGPVPAGRAPRTRMVVWALSKHGLGRIAHPLF